jgi:hypothetical protein
MAALKSHNIQYSYKLSATREKRRFGGIYLMYLYLGREDTTEIIFTEPSDELSKPSTGIQAFSRTSCTVSSLRVLSSTVNNRGTHL